MMIYVVLGVTRDHTEYVHGVYTDENLAVMNARQIVSDRKEESFVITYEANGPRRSVMAFDLDGKESLYLDTLEESS